MLMNVQRSEEKMQKFQNFRILLFWLEESLAESNTALIPDFDCLAYQIFKMRIYLNKFLCNL